MKTSDFDYFLPEELIAQTPIAKRDESRLLVLDKGDLKFSGEPREGVADIKMFKALGINVPPVAELSDRMRDAGLYTGDVAMTVPEAAEMVKEVLAE